ncbi:MAG: hypothetical protein NWE96_07535 [Candidatus Bathyarchaeota archaeon]|nr:hypothetical protein [Candidatus Bathyarchaeota archaeon]
MITTPSQNSTQGVTSQFALEVVNYIPGIPIGIMELSGYSLSGIGLVSWIIGLNVMIIGLGLWVKHKYARFAALTIFGLAFIFQFFQFLLSGLTGSLISVIQMGINGVIAYLLLSKFEVTSDHHN